MIVILILAPPTLGARGTCPHLPSPSYATDVLLTQSNNALGKMS